MTREAAAHVQFNEVIVLAIGIKPRALRRWERWRKTAERAAVV